MEFYKNFIQFWWFDEQFNIFYNVIIPDKISAKFRRKKNLIRIILNETLDDSDEILSNKKN